MSEWTVAGILGRQIGELQSVGVPDSAARFSRQSVGVPDDSCPDHTVTSGTDIVHSERGSTIVAEQHSAKQNSHAG